MKERPILFSAPMVRGILSGGKSQTRRVVKPQPHDGCGRIWCEEYNPTVIDRWGDEQPGKEIFGAYSEDGEWGVRCPFGQPGDRLWVRETWADLTATHGRKWEKLNSSTNLYERGVEPFVWYRADGEQPCIGSGRPLSEPWKPSIHMPRWASRITLEVTGVRVERLQDITPAECVCEGYESDLSKPYWSEEIKALDWYRDLWGAINGPGSWEANPLVWVIQFERVLAKMEAL